MSDVLSLNTGELADVPPSTLHGLLAIVAGEPADQPLTRLRPQSRGGLPPRVLQRVRDNAETHLKDSISLQDLASTQRACRPPTLSGRSSSRRA